MITTTENNNNNYIPSFWVNEKTTKSIIDDEINKYQPPPQQHKNTTSNIKVVDSHNTINTLSPIKNNNNTVTIGNTITSSSSIPSSFTTSGNTLVFLKKYKSTFDLIDEQVIKWNNTDQNILIVLRNILVSLERTLILLSKTTNTSSSSTTSSTSTSSEYKKNYFKVFEKNNSNNNNNSCDIVGLNNINNNNNRNYNDNNNISIIIENEIRLKNVLKLEEMMNSLYSYQNKFKKICDKMKLYRSEMNNYLEKTILLQQPIITTTTTTTNNNNSETLQKQQEYFKLLDLNSGSYNSAPITHIDDWLHYIVNTFNLEYQRRESIIKSIQYHRPISELTILIDSYENDSTIDYSYSK